jgi:pectate lyase
MRQVTPSVLSVLALCACASDHDATREQPREFWTPPSVTTSAAASVAAPAAHAPAAGGIPAFPGAEGFGAKVTGGRGGRVIKVTTLAASGPGSLRSAVEQSGPRIIVFDVSGVIEGDVEIKHGHVTIAGQTAPSGGITIKGRLLGRYEYGVDNIIVRHVRVRPVFPGGDKGHLYDAIQLSRNAKLMIDHVSASFAIDETIDVYSAQDVTVQWSVMESSATTGHEEGKHNYGFINGPNGARTSFHHNLCAHHRNRCPAIANGPAEVLNNVMYNVEHGFVHHNPAKGTFNIVGNYFKSGPSATLYPLYFDDENKHKAAGLSYFLNDNTIDDASSPCNGRVDNPWRQCKQDLRAPESLRAETKPKLTSGLHVPVTLQASRAAYDAVLKSAGAFPRDVVSRRTIKETRDRTGDWGTRVPTDLMAGLKPASPPADQDGDGMADSWERKHSLDPTDGTDHKKKMPSGYTAIEDYINELADRLVGGNH